MATMLGILWRHAKQYLDSYWESLCWKHLILYNKWISEACKAIIFLPAVSKTARWHLKTVLLWGWRVYKNSGKKNGVLLFVMLVMPVPLDTINIIYVLPSEAAVHLLLERRRPITTRTLSTPSLEAHFSSAGQETKERLLDLDFQPLHFSHVRFQWKKKKTQPFLATKEIFVRFSVR